MLKELQRIIEDSEITKEDDSLWPMPDTIGRQVGPPSAIYTAGAGQSSSIEHRASFPHLCLSCFLSDGTPWTSLSVWHQPPSTLTLSSLVKHRCSIPDTCLLLSLRWYFLAMLFASTPPSFSCIAVTISGQGEGGRKEGHIGRQLKGEG